MTGVMALANASKWFYHMGLTRLLGVAAYGQYAAAFWLYGLFMYPLGALQALVARVTSGYSALGQEAIMARFIRNAALLFTAVAAVLIFAFWLFRNTLANFLTVSPELMVPLCLAMGVSFIMPVARGALMGTQKFVALGGIILVDTLGKLGLGLGLVYFGWGPAGALWGASLAQALGVVIALWFLRKYFFVSGQGKIPVADLVKEGAIILIGFIAFYIFLQADLLLVRREFAEQEAGLFAVVRKLGDAVALIPMPIVMVVFPMAAYDHAVGKQDQSLLAKAGLATVILSGGGALILSLAPKIILRLFSGTAYLHGSGTLSVIGWVAVPTALIYLLLNYGLACKRGEVSWALGLMALVYLGGLGIWHGTLQEILGVEALCGVLATFVLAAMLWKTGAGSPARGEGSKDA